MSKKRNKSRLTKTDVNTICEMQKKIDAYESYLSGLWVHSLKGRDTTNYVVLMIGTDLDNLVNETWNNIRVMKEKLEKYENTKKD